MNRLAIGRNIMLRLVDRGEMPEQMAHALKLTPTTVDNWIKGTQMPKAYGLYRVAKHLGVTMDSLMEGIDDA